MILKKSPPTFDGSSGFRSFALEVSLTGFYDHKKRGVRRKEVKRGKGRQKGTKNLTPLFAGFGVPRPPAGPVPRSIGQ